jgi:segregation and condensation protein B
MLRQLLEKGLVKIAGRSPELGRPFLYATTKQFLSRYGLNRLSDLPDAAELCGQGLLEENDPANLPLAESTTEET